MTTELPPEVLQLGTQLTASMARNGSAMIMGTVKKRCVMVRPDPKGRACQSSRPRW